MIEHNLTIDFDLGTNTVTDCLPADTFDVSALKKESPDGPVLDLAPGDAELDARAEEVATTGWPAWIRMLAGLMSRWTMPCSWA